MAHETISVAALLSEEPYETKPVRPWIEEAPIDWQLDPGGYTNADEIHVDVTNTRRMLRIAGFAGMTIRHTINEQQTDTNNMVVSGFGIGADGSATAVGAARRSAEPKLADSSFTRSGDERRILQDYVWPRLTVDVDRASMGQRVSELMRSKHRPTREQAWALTIDSALREGIGTGARLHLVPTDTFLERFGSFVGGYWMYLSTSSVVQLATETAHGEIAHTSMFNAGLYAALVGFTALGNKAISGQTYFQRKRYSMSPGSAQPDRYLAARFFGMTHTFVSAQQ